MANLWRKFRSILPADPLLIGTIASVDSTRGTVKVTLPGGGTLIARGTGTVADTVFIRAGQIQGTVNDLTVLSDLEV